MSIKPQYILRSFLLLPFFGWGLALALSFLLTAVSDVAVSNPALDVVLGGLAFFSFGIVGWGIPYILLAGGIFVWSLKKTAAAIYKALIVSPLLLSILTFIELTLLIFLPEAGVSSIDDLDPLAMLGLAVVLPLAVGYLFVGLGALIYWGFKRAGWVAEDAWQ